MTGGAMLDRSRLAKLCGMFGSDHDGERANAAAAADKLVRQAGLRWPDVILPCGPGVSRMGVSDDPDDIDDVRAATAFCRQFPERLTAWEQKFVASIARRPGRLSAKQRAVLQELVAKCRAAGRTAP